MPEGLRASLLLFALLTSLSAVPVIMRRLRPLTLLASHALGLLVVVAVVLAAVVGTGDVRPLLLPWLVGHALTASGAAGPGGPIAVPRVLRRVGFGIGLFGVLVAAATSLGFGLPFVDLVLAVVAAAFGGGTGWALLRRARRLPNKARRLSEGGAAVATLLATLGVVVALLGGPGGAGLWAVLLGAAGAVLTSARVPPFSPPSGRELVGAFFVGLALLFSSSLRGSLGDALVLGAEAGLVTLGVLAASRPLFVAREALRPKAAAEAVPPPARDLVAEAALAHMAPMLDDALLYRPQRPRVNARVTAKRLLEAALERARTAQPPGRRAHLQVEVREDDADADVEGDPGELAEALCAVLDNALCLKNEHPGLFLRVHVRGSPAHVTFEVTDDLAEQVSGDTELAPVAARAFASAREGERPGLGVGLSRARLLVERHGGVLLVRRTQEGSCVQLTLPRRRTRHSLGIA